MIDKKELEQKFSRHIGRILSKVDDAFVNVDCGDLAMEDIKEFTKGELWLLCKDLIIMLGMNEEKNDRDFKK
jgi:hypothetical protein